MKCNSKYPTDVTNEQWQVISPFISTEAAARWSASLNPFLQGNRVYAPVAWR